jgi:hypothetical protein
MNLHVGVTSLKVRGEGSGKGTLRYRRKQIKIFLSSLMTLVLFFHNGPHPFLNEISLEGSTGIHDLPVLECDRATCFLSSSSVISLRIPPS